MGASACGGGAGGAVGLPVRTARCHERAPGFSAAPLLLSVRRGPRLCPAARARTVRPLTLPARACRARAARRLFFFFVIVHQTAHAPAPSPAAPRAHLGPRRGSSPRDRSAPRAPRRRRRALSFPSHRKKRKRKKRCEPARNQIKSQRGRRTSDRSFQRRVAHIARLGEFLPHGRSVLVT